MNEVPADVPPPTDWAKDDEDQGFWSRFKKNFAGGAPEPAPPPAPAPIAPVPRKIKKTVFEGAKKPETRGTRLRRVAREKQENLALVVGAEVEKVIVEKIQPKDEALGRVAEGFSSLEDVLSKIPESAGAQAEAMTGQLTTLRGVHGELELHRAQRERLIEGVARVEKTLQDVVSRIESQSRAASERALEERKSAAEETDRLERGMAFFAARVHEQSSAILAAQENAAAGARAAQASMRDALEEAQLRTAATVERLLEEKERKAREGEARERERRARDKEAWAIQRAARERDYRDREAKARRRSRIGRLVAVTVLLVGAGIGVAFFQVEQQRASLARDTEERADRALEEIARRAAPVSSGCTTLPAGFVREQGSR
jgi:hypothetical protein